MATMMFDFSRLRGRIVEKYGSCANFAAAMGKTKGWLSGRLRNSTPWLGADMCEAAALLDISPEEIPLYFLTQKF